MNISRVLVAANTHGVMKTGMATGLVTAITANALALAHLLGDWKFDQNLTLAVRTGVDPNYTIPQVIAGAVGLTILIVVALVLTAIGRAPQIPDQPTP